MTAFLILAFIALAMTGAESEAFEVGGLEVEPFIEIGYTFNELEAAQGGAGIAVNNKYQIARKFIAESDNKYGHKTPKAYIWSVDRIYTPKWFNSSTFLLVGVAKIKASNLVDDYNYHVAGGWQFKESKLYVEHFSSGGINEVNTGISMVTFRIDW